MHKYLIGLLLLSGCAAPYYSPAYREFYAHLQDPLPRQELTWDSDFFLIIFVEAHHLDYTDNHSFLKTLKRAHDVGHAWIHLQGIIDDQIVCIAGGQSGECGRFQAKYFDGIMNYLDYGYANPTRQQLLYPRYEPNPARYLWEAQRDGFFEVGSGNHRPTFAAKIDLTPAQFQRIWNFAMTHDYSNYSLIGNQCASFVAQTAAFAGVDLECETTIYIDPVLYVNGDVVRMWTDPRYSELTIATPDIVERSLMEAVRQGRAQQIRLR